ncbi:MAG: hypothetical protein R3F30_15935 [Planctomycetota bacterium]
MTTSTVEDTARRSRLARALDRPLWLFLLPILIGVAFWSDSSSHGDAAAYRTLIWQTCETWQLPLGRLEWLHPAHYLACALLFAPGRALGLWDDPIHACTLVNFLAMGWLAWLTHRVVRALTPSEPAVVAWLPALFVATIPGWLWTAQRPMTDVCGHALALIVAGRLLLHEVRMTGSAVGRIEPRWGYALTGALAGVAFLVRISAVGFLPLYLYLGVRVWVATPRNGRLPRLLWSLGGALLPFVVIYGDMILAHGWSQFRTVYFHLSRDNVGMRDDVPTVLAGWWAVLELGLGHALWLGVAGIALAIVGLLRGASLHPFRSRNVLLPAFLLLLLPYAYLVARNRAWYEFRYQLPMMFALALASVTVALLLVRLRLRLVAVVLVPGVLVLDLVHAWPWLETFANRTTFIEAGVRETRLHAPADAVILAHSSAPYFSVDLAGDVRVPGHFVVPVRLGPEEDGLDTWNLSWSTALGMLDVAAAEGQPVWCFNEAGLDRIRGHLRELGWHEVLEASRSGDGLRTRKDILLAWMDLDSARTPGPLLVYRLVPPPEPRPAITHEVTWTDVDGRRVLELDATLAGFEGQDFEVLFGSRPHRPITPLGSRVWLPFATTDPVVLACTMEGFLRDLGLPALRGRIGPDGRVRLRFEGRLSEDLARLWSTVLIERPDAGPRTAVARTPVVPGPDLETGR